MLMVRQGFSNKRNKSSAIVRGNTSGSGLESAWIACVDNGQLCARTLGVVKIEFALWLSTAGSRQPLWNEIGDHFFLGHVNCKSR
jgi:hypothetical protein